jgi:DNA-directed RNA polymerase subunit M
MEFCPDCGSIIQPETNDDGQTVLDCSNCSYSDTQDDAVSFSEKSKKQEGVEVIEDEENDTKPVVEKECPECDNDEAKFWTMQTRAGDEAETRFFECTACGHTWREY